MGSLKQSLLKGNESDFKANVNRLGNAVNDMPKDPDFVNESTLENIENLTKELFRLKTERKQLKKVNEDDLQKMIFG